MENPYQPPAHAAVAQVRSGRLRRVLIAVVSGLIGLLCVLQFLVIWTQFAMLVVQFGIGGSWSIVWKMLMPFSLMLAGVFLVFRRRLSALFFAAYLVQYIAEFGRYGDFDNAGRIGNLVLSMAFLGYALWLWKAGELRGWPTRQSGS